jgi:hypothetical protein
MRDDLVMAVQARRLRAAGLVWRPQVGDWCMLLAAADISGEEAGIWLVIDAEATGTLTVVDGAARWSGRRIVASEALWLPTCGQLKGWLRGAGYSVSSLEGVDQPAQTPGTPTTQAQGARPAWAAALLGVPTTPPQPAAPLLRHRCRALRPGTGTIIEGDGLREADAVAEAVARVLAHGPALRRE